MSQTFLVFLIVLAFIGILVAVLVNTWRRRQALAGWASSHGLEFRPAHDRVWVIRYPHFACLNQGDILVCLQRYARANRKVPSLCV